MSVGFGRASHPERLLRLLPAGHLTQRAVCLTPLQASGDVGDAAEICVKSDRHIGEFGRPQRTVMTTYGLRQRKKETENGHPEGGPRGPHDTELTGRTHSRSETEPGPR